MNVELWGGLSEASGGGVEDEEREEEEEEEEEEEGMRCGGGAAESSKMLTQQTGGAAENSKMLTQQTGRGDRWLRGAGGDPPALPPFPGGAPGEEGRRPSACPRRGYGD